MPHILRPIGGSAGAVEKMLPGVTAIKTGGHFPGSLVLHWEKKLFIADTIVTVPVSTNLLLTLCSFSMRDAFAYRSSLHIRLIRVPQVRQATLSNGQSQT